MTATARACPCGRPAKKWGTLCPSCRWRRTVSLMSPEQLERRRTMERERSARQRAAFRAQGLTKEGKPYGPRFNPVIDPIAVELAVSGTPTQVTRRERLEVVRILTKRGLSARYIAGLTYVTADTIHSDRTYLRGQGLL